MEAEAGFNATVAANFNSWEWMATPPFPQFLLPERIGEAEIEFKIGPYLRAELTEEYHARLDGFIKIKADVAPTFRLKELTGNVSTEVQIKRWTLKGGRSFGYVNDSPNTLANFRRLASASPLKPKTLSDDWQFEYSPTGAIGTTNVYGSQSVLGDVMNDRFQDGLPVFVKAADGTRC